MNSPEDEAEPIVPPGVRFPDGTEILLDSTNLMLVRYLGNSAVFDHVIVMDSTDVDGVTGRRSGYVYWSYTSEYQDFAPYARQIGAEEWREAVSDGIRKNYARHFWRRTKKPMVEDLGHLANQMTDGSPDELTVTVSPN